MFYHFLLMACYNRFITTPPCAQLLRENCEIPLFFAACDAKNTCKLDQATSLWILFGICKRCPAKAQMFRQKPMSGDMIAKYLQ